MADVLPMIVGTRSMNSQEIVGAGVEDRSALRQLIVERAQVANAAR